MSNPSIQELREFHRFLGEKLSNGGADLSPEEALDEWRRAHPEDGAFAEDIAAVQEALDDMANGDKGMPFEDFDRAFRERHHVPDNP
jgi:hypothetical protein